MPRRLGILFLLAPAFMVGLAWADTFVFLTFLNHPVKAPDTAFLLLILSLTGLPSLHFWCACIVKSAVAGFKLWYGSVSRPERSVGFLRLGRLAFLIASTLCGLLIVMAPFSGLSSIVTQQVTILGVVFAWALFFLNAKKGQI